MILRELKIQKYVLDECQDAVRNVLVQRHTARQCALSEDPRTDNDVVLAVRDHAGHRHDQLGRILVIGMHHYHNVCPAAYGLAITGFLVAAVAVILLMQEGRKAQMYGHFDGFVGACVIDKYDLVHDVARHLADGGPDGFSGIVRGHHDDDPFSVEHIFEGDFTTLRELLLIDSVSDNIEMMKVLLADEYGFCFGVERAVEMVEEAVAAGETVRSLGPLIHNKQEMQRLAHEGVTAITEPIQIQRGETAVIRAHGVTPGVQQELEEKASKVVDATCPFVTRVQRLASRAAAKGRHVVVVGSPDHPEMIGVKGYAPEHAFVIKDETEVPGLPRLKHPLVVAQTTIKAKTFFDTAEAIKDHTEDEVEVVNTICSATRDRQEAARALAGMVDAFYIIGGRHSSNSVKLLAVCKEQCEKSFLIETEEEIDAADLAGVKQVGVTAGASTPDWLIQRVVQHLESFGNSQGLQS